MGRSGRPDRTQRKAAGLRQEIAHGPRHALPANKLKDAQNGRPLYAAFFFFDLRQADWPLCHEIAHRSSKTRCKGRSMEPF